MQTNDFHSDAFTHIKSIKTIKTTKTTYRRTSDFLLLRCFLCSQKYCPFCFIHKKDKKQKKHVKSIKTQKGEYATFFPFGVFFKNFLSAFKTAVFVFVCYGLTFTNLPIPKLLLSSFFCLKNKTALIPSFISLLHFCFLYLINFSLSFSVSL